MLTLQDLLTSSGKYPERAKSTELTDEIKANGEKLLESVNSLLKELGITGVKISSGFRPSSVNSKVPNAAKRSLHMICKAVDLEDKNGEIDKAIASRDDLKKKYGLWQEACGSSAQFPDKTVGWAHLDNKDRGSRKENMFNP
jgi:hypothetical protein